MRTDPDQIPEDKIQRTLIHKLAILVAFISVFFFFIKILFL